MNLVIDIGNTSAKLAALESGRVVCARTTAMSEDSTCCVVSIIDAMLSEYPAIDRAIVSSSGVRVADIVRHLRGRVATLVDFDARTPVPIANAYATPETLGRDRLAAAVGATVEYPGRNVLIVDFGTAITVDLVTADATYRGGFISPGVSMRLRALHDYTASLPLCQPTDTVARLGTSTTSSIEQGVMCGVSYEIEGHIARFGEENEEMLTIFTGGDTKYFVKRIKNTIFADCNLVFCGLNRILEYNASEESHN